MSLSDFSVLRERCFSLVRAELKAHYKGELIEDIITLTQVHRMLPAVPLLENTYRGILGYHRYLQQQGDVPIEFFQNALHDLTKSVHFDRKDGFIPRTADYVKFYEL